MFDDPIKCAPVPGGKAPIRGHNGRDAAHDCFTRAIISTVPDPKNPRMRTTISDFSSLLITEPVSQYSSVDEDDGGIHWLLAPGDSISIGLGFNIEIPFGLAGFIHIRGRSVNESGIRHHLEVLNPNPIDTDFIGEPWAEIRNGGKKPYKIYKDSRLVQITIAPVWMGKLLIVDKIAGGERGTKSNGSSGS